MNHQFIQYLIALPTLETSPLYLVVNTSAMKALVFGNALDTRNVALIDSYAQVPAAPYVLLRDTGTFEDSQTCLGGSSYDKPVMIIECVAVGLTATSASNGAYHLAQAVTKKLTRLKGLVSLTSTDLGGTGSVDRLENWRVKMAGSPNRVVGSGNTDNATFLAYWNIQMTTFVFRGA